MPNSRYTITSKVSNFLLVYTPVASPDWSDPSGTAPDERPLNEKELLLCLKFPLSPHCRLPMI